MINVEENYNLKELNTFGVSAEARFFVRVETKDDLLELINLPVFKDNEKLFLGGGSNVLFTKNWEGIVVLIDLGGIEVVREVGDDVWVKAMSGEVWNDLVEYTTKLGFWGIENLALIPGSVGGAPMQNIGAYGVEICDTLTEVQAVDIKTGDEKVFENDKCCFGYRDSVFKNELKGQYVITSITLKLSKKYNPQTTYKALATYLEENQIEVKSPKDIADAVSEIRRSKLPDPGVIGNAGSFFKNVFVSKDKLEEIQAHHPEVPFFESDGKIKIPTGWLVEHSGPDQSDTSWKGYKVGNVGVYAKQALVLVNHGGGKGEEVWSLAQEIMESVKAKFGIELTPEVNIV